MIDNRATPSNDEHPSNDKHPNNDEHPFSHTQCLIISWYMFLIYSNVLFIILGLGSIIADGCIAYTAIAMAAGSFYTGSRYACK